MTDRQGTESNWERDTSSGRIEATSGEVFELVNHELRIDILKALVDQRQSDPERPCCSYSELLATVGTPDSGQFNYHLSRLRPQLVSKTDEGYCLSVTGRRITGALLAGTYGEVENTVDGTLEESCPTCNEPLHATFESGLFRVTCPSDHVDLTTGFPDGVVHGRTIQDIATIAAQTVRQDVERALEGLCPHCYGHMQSSIETTGEYNFTALCERCGMLFDAPVGFAVIGHPSVTSFLYDCGYDPRTHPPWAFEFCLSDEFVDQVGTNPFSVRIRVEVDNRRLDVEVDDAGNVISAVRSRE